MSANGMLILLTGTIKFDPKLMRAHMCLERRGWERVLLTLYATDRTDRLTKSP